ncbi:hypothetical protein HDR67_01270 [bacterium]|nr:hypothetical protein [bacterium]
MEEFNKNKRKHKRFTIVTGVVAVICCIASISLDFLAEIDNTIALIFFVIAFALMLICGVCIFIFYKIDCKITKKLMDQLNQEIDREYSYDYNIPITDIMIESMYSIPFKTMTAYAKESISGTLEDISFEYYLFSNTRESILPNHSKDIYELYIYKNSSVFSKEFFVTKNQLKKIGEYRESSVGYIYIYTKQSLEFSEESLPSDVFFLSVNEHTLYVFKSALRKQPLYMQAENLEEFKEFFTAQIEQIKLTYEQTKVWTK